MATKVCIDQEQVPPTFFFSPPAGVQNTPPRAYLLYFRAIEILRRRPDVIPPEIIDQLRQAAELGYELALEELVQLIRRNTLPNIPPQKKFLILEQFATKNKDAAFECALAYINMGNFKQPANSALAKINFIRAIELGHEKSFAIFLSAICDGHLKITTEEFTTSCNHLIKRYHNTEVALTFGSLYCGLTIINRPELNKFKLNDPNKGFDLLKFVFEQGEKVECQRAYKYIVDGFHKKKFSSPAALAFQKQHKISIFVNSPSSKLPNL